MIPKPALYDALRASGNLPRFPALMRNGWLHTELTASHERLSAFTGELTASKIPYQVLSVTQSPEPVELLTERQLELVSEAVEQGYYDSPRGCTLTELAESFDINKSAASGILHRAEGRIVKEFVEQPMT
ncbi:helix-turn-helix domain-containing protein [Haladaptatus sp. DFWS20]|uniref:helix-turn-helix domain-containing protein n=1 Tax=Haladaptatus sp. DFWS20 TaxID=3403467 RepID=UPI003EB76649